MKVTPKLINTETGSIFVWGHELISYKDLKILEMIFNREEIKDIVPGYHGVKSIIIRADDQPKDTDGEALAGACSPNCGSMVISLRNILDITAAQDLTRGQGINVHMAFHRRFILVVLHELHHLCMTHESGPIKDEEELEQLEDEADEWALLTLLNMAKDSNIEPSHYMDHPFLRAHIYEKAEKDKVQIWMLENNVSFHIPETDHVQETNIVSFKRAIGMIFNEDLDEDVWAKAPPDEPGETVTLQASQETQVTRETVTIVKEGELQPSPGPAIMSAEQIEHAAMAEMNTPSITPSVTNTLQAPPSVTNTLHQPSQNVTPTVTYTPPATGVTQGPQHFQPAPPAKCSSYAEIGLTKESAQDILFGTLNKVYNHIFEQCGNANTHYTNAGAAATIPIVLDENEKKLFLGWAPDNRGRNDVTDGTIRGFVTSRAGIPMYKLYLNNDGEEMCIAIMPQNPQKTWRNGQLSTTAAQAQAGNRILFVMDGRDKPAGSKATYYFKCTNGQWERLT